jgi:hypothetical protein
MLYFPSVHATTSHDHCACRSVPKVPRPNKGIAAQDRYAATATATATAGAGTGLRRTKCKGGHLPPSGAGRRRGRSLASAAGRAPDRVTSPMGGERGNKLESPAAEKLFL